MNHIIQTRVALLIMVMVTCDSCGVTSHRSSSYLYVTVADFHYWFVTNWYATLLPVKMACSRKPLSYVSDRNITFHYFDIIMLSVYIVHRTVVEGTPHNRVQLIGYVRVHVINFWIGDYTANNNTCLRYRFLTRQVCGSMPNKFIIILVVLLPLQSGTWRLPNDTKGCEILIFSRRWRLKSCSSGLWSRRRIQASHSDDGGSSLEILVLYHITIWHHNSEDHE
jgi:hypothetical protein